ncbi:MAG TPA: septum formation family protein [Marmoricola sp.]
MSRPGRTARTARAAVALALTGALTAVAACSGGSAPHAERSTSAPSRAPAPPSPPPRHACYDLDFAQAARPSTTAAPVPCSTAHTTATIAVGTIRPVVDGHLLAVDSDTVQQQVAQRCRDRLSRHLGGDAETLRLSRLTVVWFTPSLADSDRGALWFRCDLVALAGHDQLATLPRRTRDLLATEGVLDRFGTCGTASPAAEGFTRVICSARHTWRARATVALPEKARYLGKAAGAAADSACHDVDARLAADVLRLKWSFEWPTREQWDAGQRYGLCWTPDPA